MVNEPCKSLGITSLCYFPYIYVPIRAKRRVYTNALICDLVSYTWLFSDRCDLREYFTRTTQVRIIGRLVAEPTLEAGELWLLQEVDTCEVKLIL